MPFALLNDEVLAGGEKDKGSGGGGLVEPLSLFGDTIQYVFLCYCQLLCNLL